MKLKLITLAAACAAAFAVIPLAQAQDPAEEGTGEHVHGHHGHGHKGASRLEHVIKDLNLTPDQQAKVQPIIDQAKPQIAAIHQDAMQKSKTVMDGVISQIRPLLTPEQQQKLDAKQKAREEKRQARAAKREAKQESL